MMLDEIDVQIQDIQELRFPPSDSIAATIANRNRLKTPIGWTVGACLATAGIGGALMYLFDPVRGRQRRGVMRDKGMSLLRRGTRRIESSAERCQGRLSGAAASARHLLDFRGPGDEVLEARIGSQIGHIIAHPHDVDTVVQNGVAILRGKVAPEEMEGLLHGVAGIPGVKQVENQLLGSAPVVVHGHSMRRLVTGLGLALGLIKFFSNPKFGNTDPQVG